MNLVRVNPLMSSELSVVLAVEWMLTILLLLSTSHVLVDITFFPVDFGAS
jgi:hypothetical protein